MHEATEEMDWVECMERGYIREGYKGKKEKRWVTGRWVTGLTQIEEWRRAVREEQDDGKRAMEANQKA